MESLLTFELSRPTDWPEALQALASGDTRVIAGGTDLLPNLRRGIASPARLLAIDRLPGFDEITESAQGVGIGAAVTLARLANDTHIAERYPALVQAAHAVAGPAHRNAATIGGNLCQDTRCVYYNQSAWWRAANDHCLKRGGTVCHVAPQGKRCNAAYAGDLAPALMVLGAELELVCAAGRRRLPADALYHDDGAAHLVLAPGELVRRVWLPPAQGVSGYLKGRVRGAMDFALAGVAASLVMRGGRIAALRLAITGTDSHPILLQGTEGMLGRAPDDEAFAALAKLVAHQVSPARTTVTPSHHRRQVASALAVRLVRQLAASA